MISYFNFYCKMVFVCILPKIPEIHLPFYQSKHYHNTYLHTKNIRSWTNVKMRSHKNVNGWRICSAQWIRRLRNTQQGGWIGSRTKKYNPLEKSFKNIVLLRMADVRWAEQGIPVVSSNFQVIQSMLYLLLRFVKFFIEVFSLTVLL